MPEDKSIYDVYSEAGKSMGEYGAKLRGVEDVWGDIEFSRKRTAWKGRQRERTLDTILAGTELLSTVGGGFAQRSEDISMIEEASGKTMKKVTKYGEDWGDLKPWEKLWHGKRYQFGESVMSKSQLGFAATKAKAGMKIDWGAEKYKAAERKTPRKEFLGEYKGPDILKGKSPTELLTTFKDSGYKFQPVSAAEQKKLNEPKKGKQTVGPLDAPELNLGPGAAGDQPKQGDVTLGTGKQIQVFAENLGEPNLGKDTEPSVIAGAGEGGESRQNMIEQTMSGGRNMLEMIMGIYKGDD